MNDAKRKRVLRNLGPESIALLRIGKLDGEVLVEASRRKVYWIQQAEEVNAMLEAAKEAPHD